MEKICHFSSLLSLPQMVHKRGESITFFCLLKIGSAWQIQPFFAKKTRKPSKDHQKRAMLFVLAFAVFVYCKKFMKKNFSEKKVVLIDLFWFIGIQIKNGISVNKSQYYIDCFSVFISIHSIAFPICLLNILHLTFSNFAIKTYLIQHDMLLGL